MNINKQVSSNHYQFKRYMQKPRWTSIWHQLDEAQKSQSKNTLEVGCGTGLFKAIGNQLELNITTLDIDPELRPDYIGDATKLPFQDNSFDLVCAFQMLEHLPYKKSLTALKEYIRVSKKHIIISLPDCRDSWRICFRKTNMGTIDKLFDHPFFLPKEHIFDGEHYWEINKKGYELNKIIQEFGKMCGIKKTFRVKENPYHRFFIFEK